MTPRLRAMRTDDIEAGLALCRAAGWNQRSDEWEWFLTTSPGQCLVATVGGDKIAGTVTTIRYEARVGWIGMLLVFPEYRRQGIGQLLLDGAMKMLTGLPAVKLDATPAGREVYRKHGFVDEFSLTRMVLENRENTALISPGPASPLRVSDFAQVSEWDPSVFGADRSPLLRWLWERAPWLALCCRDADTVTGYCLGREGYHYLQVGPVVALNVDEAKTLIINAIQNAGHRRVVIDVPHRDDGWEEWLTTLGFEKQREFMRMYAGTNPWPGNHAVQFAIAGPEFG